MAGRRVLVVDDDQRTVELVKLYLNRDGYRVLTAYDGVEALRLAREGHPDLIVLDLMLPGIDGLEASRKILAKDQNAKILIFSVYENEVYLTRSLDLGVLGYITKRSASKVMIEAVRQIATGKSYVGQEMMPYLVKSRNTGDGDLVSTLSPREFEVFLLLADSQSVNEIAELLNLSPKTVGHHYTHLKNKLGINDIAGLTRLAIRNGLMNA